MKKQQIQDLLHGESHFFLKCDKLAQFKNDHGLSERKLSALFSISKSEIHRMLLVARTDIEIRISVLEYGIDFYALVLFHEADESIQGELKKLLVSGQIRKHKQIKDHLSMYGTKWAQRQCKIRDQIKFHEKKAALLKKLLHTSNEGRVQ